MSETIRVAIVDSHPIFRQGLAAVLAADKKFDLVAEGANGPEALAIATKHKPDILLLDILLRGDGVETLKLLAPHLNDINIVIVTASEKIEHVSMASTLGARGFVVKSESAAGVLNAIETVHRGEPYVTPHLAANMFKNIKRRKAAVAIKAELKSLTKRESEILTCVGRGLTNKEIAVRLGIREKTVKHYMTIIMNKLQVQNRVQAALVAQRSDASSHEAAAVGF